MRQLLIAVLCLAACKPPQPTLPTAPAIPQNPSSLDEIRSYVGQSACAKYDWPQRGTAPKGYTIGVALVFARAACQGQTDIAKANTGVDSKDAISWYNSNFDKLGMKNDGGPDTLRHVYTLLLGLGMRESSGRHCCGRDTSASNTSSDSAEAGAFQTSWDSHGNSPLLTALFQKYKQPNGCMLQTFAQGVTCSQSDWKIWGSGDGATFQELEKNCPAFSAEYAAIMLRVGRTHYGPINTKAAEIRPECDAMLSHVASMISPSICQELAK